MPQQFPAHVQHWPDNVLPTRLEEFVLDDGPPSQNKHKGAKFLSGAQVLDMVSHVQFDHGYIGLSPLYYVATVAHEAGCSNEVDTEIATPDSPAGFVSVGAYQIGQEEAQHHGYALIEMIDFEKATICMSQLSEERRMLIRGFAGLTNGTPDPAYTDAKGKVWPGGQVRFYAAICHNQGEGAVARTIKRWGLDAAGYIKRNPTVRIVSSGYGLDCITGGPSYPI